VSSNIRDSTNQGSDEMMCEAEQTGTGEDEAEAMVPENETTPLRVAIARSGH